MVLFKGLSDPYSYGMQLFDESHCLDNEPNIELWTEVHLL
jgi:hypothetical protein